MYIFNSRKSEFKPHFGAMPSGEQLQLKLHARDGIYIHKLWLEIKKDGEPSLLHPMDFCVKKKNISEFKCSIELSSAGIYWYRFVVDTEKGHKILGRGDNGKVALGSEYWYQQTVYDKCYETPDSLKGGVIYHIFVDRFNKGIDKAAYYDKKNAHLKQWIEDVTIVDADGVFRANDFYGGNLQGIVDKLDYIKSLGTNIIYLSPIFESASNHRYDTADYMAIDRLLGDEESFKKLIEEARIRGMVIMLDGVFNHTGADSRYFNKFRNYSNLGAYQGIKSPYFDWYYFINFPEEYGCWWGITVTPTVNKRIESYRRFIFGKGGVIDKWTKLGVGGWRLDVVDELDKDFVDEIRTAIKKVDSNALVIGEVWEDASIKMAYGSMRPYLLGHQLDGVMNYPFKESILNYCKGGDKAEFDENIMTICENYPRKALDCCMTLIGTHDTARALNVLAGVDMNSATKAERLNYRLSKAEREHGIRLIKMATILQYTLPGLPTVFYGDEIAMEGYEDPINRRPFTWNSINDSLLAHYQTLGSMRTKYADILRGKITMIEHESLLIYELTAESGAIRVIANNSERTTELYVNGTDAMTGNAVCGTMAIEANSAMVISVNMA